MTALEHEYVLGTNDAELWRLGYQHRVWLEHAAAAWERAGFTLGQSILDVGCGPGHASIDLAHLVGPAGRIVAIDASERFVAHLRHAAKTLDLNHIEARVADVQAIDEPPVFDGAYSRWVLCFVADPEAVVAGVSRALKPGGRFVVQDYSHYRGVTLTPPSPIMQRVIDAVDQSWRMRGGDPEVARRIPEWMRRYGLRVCDVRPLVRIAAPGSPLWNWPTTFFRNYLPVLESMGLLTRDECDEWRSMWERCSQDPDARFTTPPMFDILGVRD